MAHTLSLADCHAAPDTMADAIPLCVAHPDGLAIAPCNGHTTARLHCATRHHSASPTDTSRNAVATPDGVALANTAANTIPATNSVAVAFTMAVALTVANGDTARDAMADAVTIARGNAVAHAVPQGDH